MITVPRRLSALALVLAIAACGGGGEPADAPAAPSVPVAPATPPSATFLLDYLYDWYYWADRLPPAPQADGFADAHEALAALRVADDRYSYIESATIHDAFFDDGRSLGFGIGYRIEADALALHTVEPLSPAHAAGLRRSDRIVAIDGQPVATLAAAGSLDAAFGPSTAGVVRTFNIARAGDPVSVTVRKDWYSVSHVPATALHEVAGRRIGYVAFSSFGAPGTGAWRNALDALLAAGARDLVVDLRFNGGGLLAVAAQVGSALGASDLAGRVMARMTFNDRHADSNRAFSFASDPRAGRFDRLVWITSARTCSAAEMLIAGLAPWRDATRIGSTTCGKPVGFTPPTRDGWVYSIVSFTARNAVDDGDYYGGLPPDCPVDDPIRGELGAGDEPLLAAALSWLGEGRCPAAAATKAIGDSTRDHAWRGLATITGLR